MRDSPGAVATLSISGSRNSLCSAAMASNGVTPGGGGLPPPNSLRRKQTKLEVCEAFLENLRQRNNIVSGALRRAGGGPAGRLGGPMTRLPAPAGCRCAGVRGGTAAAL